MIVLVVVVVVVVLVVLVIVVMVVIVLLLLVVVVVVVVVIVVVVVVAALKVFEIPQIFSVRKLKLINFCIKKNSPLGQCRVPVLSSTHVLAPNNFFIAQHILAIGPVEIDGDFDLALKTLAVYCTSLCHHLRIKTTSEQKTIS